MSGQQIYVSDCAPADWDAYVAQHAHASASHTVAAVTIPAQAFGLHTHFVCARGSDGRIRGVLPLVEQIIIPWTKTLVSLPFFTYGGPLADDDATLTDLIEASERLAIDRRVRRIMLRMSQPMPAMDRKADLRKVSMVLQLPGSREELAKQLGSKVRSQIRRAERVMPEVHVGHADLLSDFYPVFCSVMRDLGTPVYPRRFFETVLKAFGTQAALVVIRVDGEPVSGALTVKWRDSMEVPWAATLHRFNTSAVNMRLYWELLQLAVAEGCKTFDFGRCSRDGGTYRFKAQWGAQPVQLRWLSCELGVTWRGASSKTASDYMGPFVLIWRELPLSIVNWLGPRISHLLPW